MKTVRLMWYLVLTAPVFFVCHVGIARKFVLPAVSGNLGQGDSGTLVLLRGALVPSFYQCLLVLKTIPSSGVKSLMYRVVNIGKQTSVQSDSVVSK